jgi:hypothetical protein
MFRSPLTVCLPITKTRGKHLVRFILYSRSYCHLCDDLLQALDVFRQGHAFSVEVIDVDADPALVAQYDELVPVLFGVRADEAPRQLCHYFLNENIVREFLGEASRSDEPDAGHKPA